MSFITINIQITTNIKYADKSERINKSEYLKSLYGC